MWIKDGLLFLCYHPGIYLILIKFHDLSFLWKIGMTFDVIWPSMQYDFDLICPDWLSWFYVMTCCHDSMIGSYCEHFYGGDGTHAHDFYGGDGTHAHDFYEDL